MKAIPFARLDSDSILVGIFGLFGAVFGVLVVLGILRVFWIGVLVLSADLLGFVSDVHPFDDSDHTLSHCDRDHYRV